MKKIRSIIIVFSLTLFPFIGLTQPDPRLNGNGSSVGNTPVGSPTGSPIDGGLGILLALGLGYAGKQCFNLRKKS